VLAINGASNSNKMKRTNSASLLLLLSAAQPLNARELIRRHLGSEAASSQPNNDNGSISTKQHSFYDLSSLSSQEKIDLLQTAIQVTKLGDSIDWDEQKDKFREAVWRDLGPKSDIDASNDASQRPKETTASSSSSRRLQKSFEGDVFGQYEYSQGACPNAGSLGVPCAPSNLSELCNKYNRDSGSFKECVNACKPGFCCVHDADRELNFLAPNCNTDENCPGYNWCYIAWWKLHDTIGPALYLRLEQDDEFYDIDAEEQATDVTGDPFFEQILLHHFDDVGQIIADGTVVEEDGSSNFLADRIFLDPEYWDTDI
jgi:hypothetical protein